MNIITMVLWKIILLYTVAITVTSTSIQKNGSTESFEENININERDTNSINLKIKKNERKGVFAGGCTQSPDQPVNGKIKCSPDSGCVASCELDYKFPNGVRQLAVKCYDAEWHIVGTEWETIPHCEPICMPECQNNGICVAPHQCNCPENFSGPQCQFEEKPCYDSMPPILNSHKRCNSKSCTVSCLENFVYPDGSAVANLVCKNGNWVPTRADWVSIPDCIPICNPPCQNGGNCLPGNTCQCPQEYRGPQCQYSMDVCNTDKLGFNGDLYCSGTEDKNSCRLNCPSGIDFEFPPASAYICHYDTGIFLPQPIPQCKVDNNINTVTAGISYDTYNHIFNHTWSTNNIFWSSGGSNFNITDIFKLYKEQNAFETSNSVIFVEKQRPEPKTCFTWGGAHYKTFDDKIISFDGDCSYVMLQEMTNAILTIIVQNSPSCKIENRCFRIIKFFIGGKEYTLSRDERNVPEFRNIKKSFPIPVQLPGLRVEMSAHFIIVYLDSLGVKLKWDGALLVQIDASESMWNRTLGLCGNMNGDARDDLIIKTGRNAPNIKALANSWQVKNVDETCNEYPNTQHFCDVHPQYFEEAYKFCTKLLLDRKFKSCSGTVDMNDFLLTCLWDYCSCNDVDKRLCACDTMNVYVRQCAHKGIVPLAGWRNENLCPMHCTNGRVYMSCGPKVQSSCGSYVDTNINDVNCEEGCFCPEGTLMHEDKCIPQEECPCRLRGKLFKPGTSVAKDCNTCTCTYGKWVCTEIQCSARCAIIGDPHYTTFDGKHYDFMGQCKYYLLKGENYSIESENVACFGAISEAMGFVDTNTPSCTKTVTIKLEQDVIKLKQNKQIVINGEDINKLPFSVNGIKIQAASSIFVIVRMTNGLEIWWDGISRVYINAPSEFHGKTRGLCGTFSNNQKDDFITPDGDIEQAVTLFANKWKTSEQCLIAHDREPQHPCDLNPQKYALAEQHCSKLYTEIFSDCHWHVEPEIFYNDCLYDMCTCTTDVKTCLCPILSAYAKDCAAAGIKLLWRQEIDECSIHCPGSQIYQICGNSCKRSCGDISFNPDCKEECVEGCNCPEGETLNTYGECIPIGQCPCIYSNIEYKAGYTHLQPGQKGQELCTCRGGIWDCRLATPDEIQQDQLNNNISTSCPASKNLELTDCKPVQPRTCHNMHVPIVENTSICKPGCICKSGYVLDVINGVCIKEKECPCHHGGKSYKEESIIQSDCNTCQCISGKWNCTDRICAGVCSAWGDSHYETFDGKLFNFQGVCDYILAKGVLSKEESFDISTQNVPCGTTGVSCSKSITLKVGHGGKQEIITLTRGKALPKGNFKRIAIRTAGLYVFLDVPDLGLVVQWDKGTRVYIRLDPKWKGHTKGLCGDYNNNSEDDFKTPSGGISEVSANLFGDSWKINDLCPEPKDIKDPCEQHPERKIWAIEKCSILKSDLFRSCHSEVDIEFYMKNCIFDTCSCDTGGDCECLCTSLAAYAQQCNAKGVPIKWRTQELCPMQCDKECSTYSPCISTCPYETCDNLLTVKTNLHLCSQDACIEGCLFKPCADGYVYRDSNYTECIPKSTCKTVCAEINGTVFLEGEKVSSDNCQTCFCSRGNILCQGEPCTATPKLTTPSGEQPAKCIDGWSAWINKDVDVKGNKLFDVEPLPSFIDLGSIKDSAACAKDQIIDIKCRSVKDHLTPKESGLDVECSLERGLYCQPQLNSPCIDFEISVLCQCSATTTKTSTTIPTTTETRSNVCEEENSYKPHPIDCRIFYHCAQNIWVEKTCGPGTLYNSELKICDWPSNVVLIRPECSFTQTTSSEFGRTQSISTSYTSSVTTSQNVTSKLCKDGEEWSECAIKCSQTCEYFHYSLLKQDFCKGDIECIPGCVSLRRAQCPASKLWKDLETCVDPVDCTCKSHNGESVKPGTVVEETECELCQCINNYYTCDKTSCTNVPSFETTSSTPLFTAQTESSTIIIISSTVTPPRQCDSGRYIPLTQQFPLNEISFNASSYNGPEFQPENALFNNGMIKNSSGSWQPKFVNDNQWLSIQFPHAIPIYGIILKGSPDDNKFVTSYQILFSEDGYTFSYVTDATKQPRIFRGPVDSMRAVEQKFDIPIEAKIIRINPLTWHNGIAIKAEIVGCEKDVATTKLEKLSTTQSITLTTKVVINPICNDSMGLDEGLMSDVQVSSSSSLGSLLPNLRLSSPGIWRPRLDNLNQYVQFNFMEPRNVTGIITKGDNDIWTTVYKIFYSIDGRQWNPIIDDNGIEMEFLGNFDSRNPQTNFFEKPLQTTFLRVQPIKWHRHIGLKVEILGCFIPYPVISTTPLTPTTSRVPACHVCDGVPMENTTECKCDEPLWWNGNTCVSQQKCPCIVDHISYAVGSMYETEDCQQCTCTLGGVPVCIPKKCDPCPESGMQAIVTQLCSCICKPCPSGTRHCPTSNTCINETLWCNGVQDCPDDERDCPTTTLLTTTTTHFESTTIIPYTTTKVPDILVPCENPICPPGYKVVVANSYTKSHSNIYSNTYTKSRKSSIKGLAKRKYYKTSWIRDNTIKYENYRNNDKILCSPFTCVPTNSSTCEEVICPPHYTVKYEKMSMYKMTKCRKYTCEPPVPQVAVCSVIGRTFNTFDNLEYKYDICNNILARDMYGNKWYITLEQQCDKFRRQCSNILAVYIDDEVVVLYPDMHIDVNYYTYTSNQVWRLSDKFKSFKISHIGDTIHFISRHYGFWIIWNSDANVKIGINKQFSGLVDGLCGYFDGYMFNDKQLPNGTQAKSTIEFGKSWEMEGAIECYSQVCPHDMQEQGWKICNSIKDRPFALCSDVVDEEKFLSRCLETVCSCLRSNSTYDNCRCRALTAYVTECQAADQTIDLSIWRNIYDCPVNCSAPFVHRDCYKNNCERSCNNLQDVDPCPVMEDVCFSGCFCPEGTVRNGNDCIPPNKCRDCSCQGFGNSKFISFDRNKFTVEGNCTYVLSRDIIDKTNSNQRNHTYQVLVSNTICDTGTCTKAIIVLYEQHVIEIKRTPITKLFEVYIDNIKVEQLSYETHWLKLKETPGKDIILLIPAIQLEITSIRSNFAFTVRVSSLLFGDAMEGLCGNCNNDIKDDLRDQNGKIVTVENFETSWLINDQSFNLNIDIHNCVSKNKHNCSTPSMKDDPCYRVLNSQFAQCHDLVDPEPYLDVCRNALCIGGDYCNQLLIYAMKCAEAGLCINWRTFDICPYTCPSHLRYEVCGPSYIETCNDIDEESGEKWNFGYVEGCFCPPNFVLHNNTCIEKEKCLICDEDGHIEGDVWNIDKCTTCSCHKNRVNCQKIECPTLNTICEENMVPKLVSDIDTDCCPKYVCIPVMKPSPCEKTKQPECGYGQIMKLHVDSEGCEKFICECVPLEECPVLDVGSEVAILEPGIVEVINKSGCCPQVNKVCNAETCPSAPVCPEYYTLSKNQLKDRCCPDYKCIPPKDICIYNTTLDLPNEFNLQSIKSKNIGEEWNEDDCRTCVCEDSDAGPVIRCSTIKCPDITLHPDINDFVLEAILKQDECCPSVERKACKEGDQIYTVGETWKPNPQDPCITKECIRDANGIQKQIQLQVCNSTCEYGFEYQPSDDTSNSCCGECIAIGCVVNGELKSIGEQWYSNDNCIIYSCHSINGSVYIDRVTEKCPDIDPLEEQEFVIERYYTPYKCCPDIVKVACRHNGYIYKEGEKWKHLNDSCITEICAVGTNGLMKQQEVELCSQECPLGWIYAQPKEGKCCGECKQAFCVAEGILYKPRETWSSNDTCETYTCLQNDDQFMISMSALDCPDISRCPPQFIYKDGCCKRCRLETPDQKTCILNTMNSSKTIGILTKKHWTHGLCTNLAPIQEITNCVGTCQSETYFDKETWGQISDCRCCQPMQYRNVTVELTCENGEKIKEQIRTPSLCSCDKCSSTIF